LELLIRKLQVADELFYRHYEGDLYKNVALLKKIIKTDQPNSLLDNRFVNVQR